MTKEKRISAKCSELMEIYRNIPAAQLKVVENLIEQAAFMAVLLEDLSAEIQANGCTVTYDNGGGQSGQQQSAAIKSYGVLISKYAAITAKLLQLLPEPEPKPEQPKRIPADIYQETANQAAEAAARKTERDLAFMEATAAGEISQSDYAAFCRQWEREHA